MSSKVETTNTLATYELAITHDELIDLMNSQYLAEATIASDQVVEIWAKDTSTTKERLLLSHFRQGSNLIIRMRAASADVAETEVGTVVIIT